MGENRFKNFSSPHVHMASLDSGSTPEAFIKRELELETGAACVTDHGTMAAHPEVYDLAKKNGLIPILGLEGYLRDDDDDLLIKAGVEKDPKGTFASYLKYVHVSIHAKDATAHEALVKELSLADDRAEQHGSERKPLFTWAQLERLGGHNITFGSGCLIGICQRHLMVGRPDLAVAYYEKIRGIAKPGNFFVELFPHKCTHNWVAGVFLTLEGGDKLKFWKGKKLKTTLGEFSAEELAKVASRGKSLGQLVAVMNDRKWAEQDPKIILECNLVEDFVPNECTETSPDGDLQLGANRFMLELANKYGDKIIPSDDSHLAYHDDKLVQDSRLMSQGGSWKFHVSYARMSSMEAYDYFKNVMGVSEKVFEGWVENSREWAQGFKDFEFNERKSLPTKFYPSNTLEHLKALIDRKGRMDWSDPAWLDRLGSEIRVLHKNGVIDLLPYFFMAEESIEVYEKLRIITGAGRGSGAGMATMYLLGITHVDPLKYKLSQDRFITDVRIASGAMPDADLDFPNREPLLDPEKGWLKTRFGDHCAAISTKTMLRLKSSIKDVARAKRGFVPPELETLCKKLPIPPQGIEDIDFIDGYVGDDGKEVKGFFETSKELQQYARDYPDEWKMVRKFIGLQRGSGRHAAAYVVANEPISNFIPLTTISGIKTTQYDSHGVEARGGIKMDFLGVSALADIQECITMVQSKCGGPILEDRHLNNRRVPGFRVLPLVGGGEADIWDLPWDQQVGNMIAAGKTETVFQLCTPSAKGWLKQFNYEKSPGVTAIDSVEAIAAFTALDRPGPLDAEVVGPDGKTHNMLIEYSRRAKGMEAVGEIPALKTLIPETYSVLTYQEQVEFVYRELTGGTAAEAEEFRRNVAKKKMEKVTAVYPAFMERASAKIGKEQAQAVFDQLVVFGRYGFCVDWTQEIMTSAGPKSIISITLDDEIATLNSSGGIEFERPVKVWQSGEKRVLEADDKHGSTIRATADHQLLHRGEWVKFGELLKDWWTPIDAVDFKNSGHLKSVDVRAIRDLGVRPVYDMEMPSYGNFILANGVVAHNCKAHAVSYAVTAYATAYLKYHYPLEWWCAVLKNADKNEIAEKFWKHCSHMVDLPDIRYSGDNFEIQNGRIRAPLGFLKGVGETAHKELVSLRPYATIEELCRKINQSKLDRMTPLLDKETKQQKVDKKGNLRFSLGRSALNQGVIGKLIVSGVADSLFPGDMGLTGKLQEYENQIIATANQIHGTKKKPKSPKPEYLDLTALSRYQLQKEILAIYSEDLQDFLRNENYPGIRPSTKGNCRFVYAPTDPEIIKAVCAQKGGPFYDEPLPFVNGAELKYLSGVELSEGNTITVAVAAYVVAERRFRYQESKKEAIDLTFDVDGETFSFVKWPDRKSGKLMAPPAGLPGAIVLLLLNRYRTDRPFVIDAIAIIKPPLSDQKEEEEADE